jgi:hypothetical protein
MLAASSSASEFPNSLKNFKPDAVLTVPHGHLWLAAARFAEDNGLPLHLVVHDDWPSMAPIPQILRPWLENRFGRVYRQAASRLCVSPFMEEEYGSRYRAPGQVLFPSRSKNSRAADPLDSYVRKDRGLVAAYAGSSYFGYSQMVSELAVCLEKQAGRLLLFGNFSQAELESLKLDRPNIAFQGFLRPEELISAIREKADFVFVPMSFHTDAIKRNMQFSFPSKLTDYTATALPLLIWGPEYCSAVQWARQCAPLAEIVTTESSNALEGSLERLQDTVYRERLGRAALDVGNRLFSHSNAMKIFLDALGNREPHLGP